MSVNVLAAVRAFLLADSAVSALTSQIYVGQLPDVKSKDMPEYAVVLHAAGGMSNNDFVEIVKPRIDIHCYGNNRDNYYPASELDLAVYSALKHLNRKTISGALLHSVSCNSGATHLKHSDTGWPIVWRSYTVTASDVNIA